MVVGCKEDLLYKMDELGRLLSSIKKENVNQEIYELCYNYSHEIAICRNTICNISNDNITYEQSMLIKQAERNINRLYQFRNYIENLIKR